jgi:uncharacterized membrane protein YeaQ/YmgE (transglycosylase-associated protein family)
MRKIGYLLISIGFLAGTLAAIIEPDQVRWVYFIGSLVVGIFGVIIARSGHRQIHTSEERLSENIRAVETSLEAIVKDITNLNTQKHSIDTYEIRHRIDELFLENLAIFVDTRHSIAHVYGLVAYGEIMSSFAAGERYLNRVWSASADGYIDEVNTYIDKARAQFAESLNKLNQFKVERPLQAM